MIRIVERVMMAVALAGGAYIGYFFLVQSKNVSVENAPETVVVNEADVPSGAVIESKPYALYAGQIESRDIFGNGSNAKTNAVVEAPMASTGQLPEYLKVVGILGGRSPQVVVEDTRMHRTFFIEEGKPDGDFTIQKSSSGKVLIMYQGQSIDIALKGNKADAPMPPQ